MGKVKEKLQLTNNWDKLRAAHGYIAPEAVRTVLIDGIVDTGAAMLVIPESVARRLGLTKHSEVGVRYADNRKATREIVDQVDLRLCDRHSVFNAIVEPDRTEALIGAIVLEALDLLVDCRKQTLHPRDPEMILTEIEEVLTAD